MTKAAELAKMGEVLTNSQIGGRRNIVINGGMNVAQRSSSTVTVSNNSNEGFQTLDRFEFLFGNNAGGVCNISQDTTVPSGYGFSNSYKVDVTTADTSLGSNHQIYIQTSLEAQDIKNSGWDYTNSNSTIICSFHARSVKAGTYCFGFRAMDSSSTKIFVKEFTLVANTWKLVSIKIPGDSGVAFNNDNGVGAQLTWSLQAESGRANASDNAWHSSDTSRATSNQVNFFDSTDNNFFLTGIQLEVGSQATPFEHRSFGEELALCMRYYEHDDSEGSDNYRICMNKGTTAASYYFAVDYAVTKRAKPTVTVTQAYSDNFVLSAHSGSSGRGHMGLLSTASGSTDTRALFEFTWSADAEL